MEPNCECSGSRQAAVASQAHPAPPPLPEIPADRRRSTTMELARRISGYLEDAARQISARYRIQGQLPSRRNMAATSADRRTDADGNGRRRGEPRGGLRTRPAE